MRLVQKKVVHTVLYTDSNVLANFLASILTQRIPVAHIKIVKVSSDDLTASGISLHHCTDYYCNASLCENSKPVYQCSAASLHTFHMLDNGEKQQSTKDTNTYSTVYVAGCTVL